MKETKVALPAIPSKLGPFHVVDSKGPWGLCGMPRDGHAGVLEVPMDDSPASKAIRVHEYGHLAMEAKKVYDIKKLKDIGGELGVRERWMQTALDIVVNSYVYRKGCGEIMSIPLGTKEELEKATPELAAMDWIRYVGLMQLSGKVAASPPSFLRKFDFLLGEAAKHLATKSISDEVIARVAFAVQSLFDNQEEEKETKNSREHRDIKNKANMLKSALHNEMRCVEPGKMEIIHIPLNVDHFSRLGRKRRPSFAGAFRYPSRAFIPMSDGKAFGTRKRIPGGTLLLDCSVSMPLSYEDINNMLDRAPHLTVALYAGAEPDMNSGRLVVVASQGKKVKDASEVRYNYLGGANVIDVPALEWLLKQTPPLTWITDGRVSGVGDSFTINIVQECHRLVQKGKVEIQQTVEDFLRQ